MVEKSIMAGVLLTFFILYNSCFYDLYSTFVAEKNKNGGNKLWKYKRKRKGLGL